ncbi:MAG: acylphosphatase [Actinomycetota bacterium]
MTKRVHVFVSGRVQGVFFRVECAREAGAVGLSGFVRNMPDGRVEAVFEGPPGDVESLVAWCRRGPEWASVEHVDVADEEPTGERDFRIL